MVDAWSTAAVQLPSSGNATISTFDNALVAGANSALSLDASLVTNAFMSLAITTSAGADSIVSGLVMTLSLRVLVTTPSTAVLVQTLLLAEQGLIALTSADTAADQVRANEGDGAVATAGAWAAGAGHCHHLLLANDSFRVNGAATSVVLNNAVAGQAAGTNFTAVASGTFN